ncbi:MAG: anthranilate synthase component I [Patescibacteria group bacterium]
MDLQALRGMLPLVTAQAAERTRIGLGAIAAGGGTPVVIAGPCAVEDLRQLLRTARRVKAAGAHGLRGGAFKPRSSPYSFQGLGEPALEMLAAAKVETGLFLVIEVMSPAEVDLVAGYADLLQIGARNMQNFALLRAAGRGRTPVLLKRGLSATIQEWLQAAEYIMAGGNSQVILCERGIRTFETMTRNTFDLAAIPLVHTLTGLPVFADPSHATGRSDLVAPMARAALAAGADGLLIEVHPDPARALSDGDQSLDLDEFEALMDGLAAFHLPGRAPAPRPPEFSLTLEEWGELGRRGYRHALLSCACGNDELTPVGVFRRLVRGRPGFLLESVEPGGNGVGRYSFCGDMPLLTVSARGRRVATAGREETHCEGDVLEILREVLAGLRVAPAEGLPRFNGGAVGYLGYDYVRVLEPVPANAPDPLGLPDSFWMIPRRLAILDHVTQTISLAVLAPTDAEGYLEAAALLTRTLAELREPPPARPEAAVQLHEPFEYSTTEAAFHQAVACAKEAIAAGEVFQVVLSQRITAAYGGEAVDLYRALRAENPSPYMFIVDCGGFQLIGSSPETMVRLEGNTAEIRPLAGTRPRGRDVAEDRANEAELRADAKECAEHVMLVDLGRNDLGRVCGYGTVRVPEFMVVERFSRVMHLVSRVTGELAPDRDAFSLLRATFPAGTLSGAPKVRAMQIISELEPFQRGIYGGAVGYVGFNGNLDTCIAIRTIVLCGGRACVQAGAGIVADSDPAREYAETLHKAAAVLAAVRAAGEGRR